MSKKKKVLHLNRQNSQIPVLAESRVFVFILRLLFFWSALSFKTYVNNLESCLLLKLKINCVFYIFSFFLYYIHSTIVNNFLFDCCQLLFCSIRYGSRFRNRNLQFLNSEMRIDFSSITLLYDTP